MNRPSTGSGSRSSNGGGLLGALMAVLVAVAVVVAIGWFLDDAVQQWWWLVAVVGVGAGLVELRMASRSRQESIATTTGTAASPTSAPAFPEPVARFDAVAVSGSPQPGWGSGVSSKLTADSSRVAPAVPEPPAVPGTADTRTGDGSTIILGVPEGGAGLDAPTVPVHPVATSAPAVVRRASTPSDGLWRSDALWTPKSSHEFADHEDAWAIDDTLGRAALSDGASSAFMARQWAMAITSRFLDDPPPTGHGGFGRWVTRATEQWATHAAAGEVSDSWWAGASEQRGSYATLIGVTLEPEESDEGIGFTALAVGDSCLVHLTPDAKTWKRALAFPLERPEDFGKHPELIATTGARSDGSMPVVRSAAGQLRAGDALVLLSDAVAQFALEIDSAGDGSIWYWLMTAGQDEFSATIAKARTACKIEDDDSTVVRIRV